MSQHQCSVDGAKRGYRCCKRFAVLAEICDRCEGDGCPQCRREHQEVEDQIVELLPRRLRLVSEL